MFGDFRRKYSVISEKLHPFIFLSKDVGQMSVLSLIYGGGEGSLVPSSSSVPTVVAGDNNATSIRFVIPSKYSSYRKDLECIVRTGDGHSAQFRYELTPDPFLLTKELTKNGGGDNIHTHTDGCRRGRREVGAIHSSNPRYRARFRTGGS